MTLQAQSLSLNDYQERLEAIIRSFGFSFTLDTGALAQQVEWEARPRRVYSGYAGRGAFDGIAGQTVYDNMTVTIRDDLSPLDIARTTTHELAHIVLNHGPDQLNDNFGQLLRMFGTKAVKGILEAEAESCTHSVLDYFGFADETWTEDYIDGWMSHVPRNDIIEQRIVKNAAHGAFKIVQLINASTS